jgi:hypothetical protein
MVEEEPGWRLRVFEAGRYLIGFDGSALLLLEIWRRSREGARGQVPGSGKLADPR